MRSCSAAPVRHEVVAAVASSTSWHERISALVRRSNTRTAFSSGMRTRLGQRERCALRPVPALFRDAAEDELVRLDVGRAVVVEIEHVDIEKRIARVAGLFAQ